uniref:Uncharacterized protein n=1 Tax=Cacopsylla melanoneura TaxID=428564 RepID=A0A8D8PLZ0_9HEMI
MESRSRFLRREIPENIIIIIDPVYVRISNNKISPPGFSTKKIIRNKLKTYLILLRFPGKISWSRENFKPNSFVFLNQFFHENSNKEGVSANENNSKFPHKTVPTRQ